MFNPTDMKMYVSWAGLSKITKKPRLDGESDGEDDSKNYLFEDNEIQDDITLACKYKW